MFREIRETDEIKEVKKKEPFYAIEDCRIPKDVLEDMKKMIKDIVASEK